MPTSQQSKGGKASPAALGDDPRESGWGAAYKAAKGNSKRVYKPEEQVRVFYKTTWK
jgi:hypothetical protein